ncbi:MAG: ribosome recycling factor [Patescibacteria group bacterium]|nr:ribosome recycling factor [Patescibacteria group bacterium]MDE1946025.1 ribosome recycling factor [Patescibacteria group bacterium]
MTYDFKKLKDKMKGAEEWLKKEYAGLRTGIASPAVLDGVEVDAYGSRMKLNQVATIGIEDARAIRISPYDKTQAKEIEKAITAANLGVSVAVDDKGVRVFFPQLSGESRANLVKAAKTKLEDARVNIRSIRDETVKEIDAKEKEGGMSEDEKFRFKNEMQKIVDDGNKALETLFEKKEKEIAS